MWLYHYNHPTRRKVEYAMRRRDKMGVVPRKGQSRRQVTLQLHPENDKDIIEWLIKQTNKQGAIKAAIRACIDGKPEALSPALLGLFSDLREYLDDQFASVRKIRGGSSPAPTQQQTNEATPINPALQRAIIGAMKPGKRR